MTWCVAHFEVPCIIGSGTKTGLSFQTFFTTLFVREVCVAHLILSSGTFRSYLRVHLATSTERPVFRSRDSLQGQGACLDAGFHHMMEKMTKKRGRTENFSWCTGICQMWFETYFPLRDGNSDGFPWKKGMPNVPKSATIIENGSS